MNLIKRYIGVIRLVLITFDISFRTVIQYWRGPTKMTRKWSDKTMLSWARRLLNAAEIDLHVHKPKKPINIDPDRSYVIMCNHTSHFDIPISLGALAGWSVRMMAKKELYNIPVFGKAMVNADFPIVDRNNRRQSFKDLAKARELMKTGIMVWVAPEGTRSKTGKLGEFKRGAFMMAIDAKAIIIPLGICGANEVLPTQTLDLHFGKKVDVYIGDPIDTSEYTSKEKDALLLRVKKSIAELSFQQL